MVCWRPTKIFTGTNVAFTSESIRIRAHTHRGSQGPGPGGTLHQRTPRSARRGAKNKFAKSSKMWAGTFRMRERCPEELATQNLTTIDSFFDEVTARSNPPGMGSPVRSARLDDVTGLGSAHPTSRSTGRCSLAEAGRTLSTSRSMGGSLVAPELSCRNSARSRANSGGGKNPQGSWSGDRERHRSQKFHRSVHEREMQDVWDKRQQRLMDYQQMINKELAMGSTPTSFVYNPVISSFECAPQAPPRDRRRNGRPVPAELPTAPLEDSSQGPMVPNSTTLPMFSFGKQDGGTRQPWYEGDTARGIRGEYGGMAGPLVVAHGETGEARLTYRGSPYKKIELSKDPQRMGQWHAGKLQTRQ